MSQATISEKEVNRIAALARLGLDADEVKHATKDLSGVLAHFAVIQNIETIDVPMSADTSGLKNVTREDSAEPDVLCSPKALLDAAPETHDGHLKVRSVFE